MARSEILADLEAVLRDRLVASPEGSYSVTLLTDPTKVSRKIMEEAFELTLELGAAEVSPQRTAEEAADLVFHVLAGLVGAGVRLDAVLGELEKRRAGEGGGAAGGRRPAR